MARHGQRRRARRLGAGIAVLVVTALASACGTAGGAVRGVGDAAAGAATPPTSAVAPSPAPEATTTLRVSQRQTGCCYPNGHLSWLIVRDRDGAEVVRRRFLPLSAVVPVTEERVPPGPYHVVSAQAPCAASSCATVGEPVDRCDADLVLPRAARVEVEVTLVPGVGCTIAMVPAPAPSPTGDEVALPAGALDCGHDASLAEAAETGDDVVPSDARRCFVAAVLGGTPAWLSAEEPELVVYRSRADATVVVYRVKDERAPVRVWLRNTCTDLVPDSVRGFLLQGCAPAEAVPWTRSASAGRSGQ